MTDHKHDPVAGKAARQLVQRYMPQIAKFAARYLPMEVLRNNATLSSWLVDFVGLLLAKYIPDDPGFWAWFDDTLQDFFAAMSNEIRSTHDSQTGKTPIAAETDAVANYIKIAGAAVLLDKPERQAFFTWYNGLASTPEKQAAFRRLAGQADKDQLKAYVTMPAEDRNIAIEGFIALDPTASKETHEREDHHLDLHTIFGWMHDPAHHAWEETQVAREHIKEHIEQLGAQMQTRADRIQAERKSKKPLIRRIF
jgi:hypothetical protein